MEQALPTTPAEHVQLMQCQSDLLAVLTDARSTLHMLRPNVSPRIRDLFAEQIAELEALSLEMGISRAMLLPIGGRPC